MIVEPIDAPIPPITPSNIVSKRPIPLCAATNPASGNTASVGFSRWKAYTRMAGNNASKIWHKRYHNCHRIQK